MNKRSPARGKHFSQSEELIRKSKGGMNMHVLQGVYIFGTTEFCLG